MEAEKLVNELKNSKIISIKDKKFYVVGYKDITLETNEKLFKFRLKDDAGKYFWLEIQFTPRDKIILWEEIEFYPNQPFLKSLEYKNKKFKLIDKGISNIKIAKGAAKSLEQEKIQWWDYKFKNEMISLGWLENAKQWENLFGTIIKPAEIIPTAPSIILSFPHRDRALL